MQPFRLARMNLFGISTIEVILEQTKPRSQVIVFSTPTCSCCNAARKYFRERGIKFRDVDVGRDLAAARDMMRRSGQQGVPVIDINGRIVLGFDRPKIDKYPGL